MTKKPISINKDALAVKALSLMNSKKITSLCVFEKSLVYGLKAPEKLKLKPP